MQIHGKSWRVWFNKDGKYESLSCIEKLDAWRKFKLHTVYIENIDLQHRLNKVITVIDNTADVFVAEVQYHKFCWKNYQFPRSVGLLCDGSQNSHIHNLEIFEIKQMFLKHVQKVILELNEPRTFRGLLKDYKTILLNFGLRTNSVKSAAIKALIQKEFGDDV